ncbi:MAG: biotin/lipoyl-containing protein [Thermodesulfobacteriota bacterium]
MQYRLRINEEIHSVEAAPVDANGQSVVALGEDERNVAVRAVSHNQLHLVVDGTPVDLFVAPAADGTWVWMDGRARFVQDADQEVRRSSRGPGMGPTEVTPPTPASVVKVLVSEGDRIEKGQPAVVVSAMKMEITLNAPYSGTVKAVNTVVGAQVSPGQILVEIEPDQEASANE